MKQIIRLINNVGVRVIKTSKALYNMVLYLVNIGGGLWKIIIKMTIIVLSLCYFNYMGFSSVKEGGALEITGYLVFLLLSSSIVSLIRGYTLRGSIRNFLYTGLYLFQILIISGIFSGVGLVQWRWVLLSLWVISISIVLISLWRSKGLGTGGRFPEGYRILFSRFFYEVSYIHSFMVLVTILNTGLGNEGILIVLYVGILIPVKINIIEQVVIILNRVLGGQAEKSNMRYRYSMDFFVLTVNILLLLSIYGYLLGGDSSMLCNIGRILKVMLTIGYIVLNRGIVISVVSEYNR